MNYFVDADFNKLWKPVTSEYKRFTLPFPTDEEVIAHEKRLGVKLPASYIELATVSQNGGLLKCNGVLIRDEAGNVIRYVKINYISPIGHIEPEYTYLDQICDYPSLLYNIPNLVVIGENWDAHYEFFVLNYRNCGADGEPTIEFITRKSKCGEIDEPVSGDWRYINENFYWELTATVANTFAEFVKQLVVMPKPVPFDFAVVKEPLKQAAQEAFRQIVKTYGQEEIISFGLYVDEEGTMVAGAANTKSHLFDPICRELSIHSRALGTENKVKRFRDKLIQLCVEILAELKAEGFFAKEYHLSILLNVDIIIL